MKPHKHAELIKAWADGAEIQVKNTAGDWNDRKKPLWDEDREYRIKPEPKPDVVKWMTVENDSFDCYLKPTYIYGVNLKLTFDGETGELKSAEVLK